MININKFVFFATIMVAVIFSTSCEKFNNKETAEISTKTSNWKITNNNYCDDMGNTGNLWMDIANPENPAVFEIATMAKYCDERVTGTMRKEDVRGVVTYHCDGQKKDCWIGKPIRQVKK